MDNPTDQDLYDEYLDACMAGTAPTPAEFLASHPEISESMHERIEAAYALAHAQSAGSSDAGATGGLPFERLGDYRLLRRLGIGGMGSVYLAEQETLGRTVALKVIRSEYRESETIMRRFEREARAVARLRHNNIVNVYEFGRDHGAHFIAMELVPGQPLDAVLRDGSASPAKILDWCAQLGRALAYAHEQGVVHRDVKPQNVMVTHAGRPVLLDFGLARMMETELSALTHEFAGTPQYAAPEQLMEQEVDGRTDVYALGVLLYEALTGRLPFEGGRLDELVLRIVREEPPRPRQVNPALSEDIETVVLKAMEKEPGRRYQTASALADDLQRARDERPVEARRPGPIVRLRKWVRRRPVVATVAAAFLLALVGAAGVVVRGVLQDQQAARELVSEARALAAQLREQRLAMRPEEMRLRNDQFQHEQDYHGPEAMAAFEERLDAVIAHRRDRDAGFWRILDLLNRAERLDDDVDGVQEVRAALFNERLEAARTAGQTGLASYYRRALAQVDPAGTTQATLGARGHFVVTTEPPGADVYLYRYHIHRDLDPQGDRRRVPVPVAPDGVALPPGVVPGQHVLRVVKGAGDVDAGDLILSLRGFPIDGVFADADSEPIRRGDQVVRKDDSPVRSMHDVDTERLENVRKMTFRGDEGPYDVLEADRDVDFVDGRSLAEIGGVVAQVFTSGRVVTIALPAGLVVRPTAAPRHVVPDFRVGPTPVAQTQKLEAGAYLVVLQRAGYEEAILPATLDAGQEVRLHAPLNPLGTTPPGFVYVSGPAGPGAVRPEGDHAFWIQEREVTNGEYLEFLNDRGRWKAAGAVEDYIAVTELLEPPFVQHQIQRGVVRRYGGGTYVLWHEHARDLPAVFVSGKAASAYARWRSIRDQRVYALPNRAEWLRAVGNDGRHHYVFGNEFRHAWTKTALSRRRTGAFLCEPAFRFPIDESPVGAFDMAGNAMEWLDQTLEIPEGTWQRCIGGSAHHGAADSFRIGTSAGAFDEEVEPYLGIRLVLRSLTRGK